MVMSKTMQKVHDLALNYDNKLKADDERFQHSVQILHEEGTTYFFHNAFMMNYVEKKANYIVVFTEHQGFHVFAEDELSGYGEFIRIYKKLEKLPNVPS